MSPTRRHTFVVGFTAVLAERLGFVSATLNGLLAGAMLFLRVVLLPFWRGLAPAEFRAWFAGHSGRIRALMVPLGVGAAGASLGATAARMANGEDARANAVAAAGSVAVVAVTVTVNEPANREFVREDFGDGETTTLLARWSRWHDVRVAFGLVAAVAAALARARR
jgi:Domain of unknown function (DUF1772)